MDRKVIYDTVVKYLPYSGYYEGVFDVDNLISELRGLGFRDDDRKACTACGMDNSPYDYDFDDMQDVGMLGNALLTYIAAVISVPGGRYLADSMRDTVSAFLKRMAQLCGGMEACDVYVFCQVVFSDFGGTYSYIVPEGMVVGIGDRIQVPVGPYERIVSATVVSVGEYMDFAAPIPVSDAKVICSGDEA